MQAQVLCTRGRVLTAIMCIWPAALLMAAPVPVCNQLISPDPRAHLHFCSFRCWFLPVFKYAEFTVFYLLPMIQQVVCYCVIGKRLFADVETLFGSGAGSGRTSERHAHTPDTMAQRRGVVKMLIASITIYFISYSPHQILLFYNTFAHKTFHATWAFRVFVTAMGYINSATNPLLYAFFSQAYRAKFRLLWRSLTCRGIDSAPGPVGVVGLRGKAESRESLALTHITYAAKSPLLSRNASPLSQQKTLIVTDQRFKQRSLTTLL